MIATEECEATGVLQVVADYTYALDTLDRYDYQKLELINTTNKELFRSLSGNEKDGLFKGSIGAV